MRDEDLKNLPQSIEPWRVKEMLGQLGITDWNNVRRMVVLPRSIQVDVFATDEKGKFLVVAEDGTREAAQHHISIPLVGSWEKPDEATQACGSHSPEGDEVCELPEAHYFCRSGGVSWPWTRPEQDALPCPAYLTLGPDIRSNCERGEGHPDEHASHVGGVLQRW